MPDAAHQPYTLRVLCVDDEPEMRSVLAALLQREHYVVEVASDGLEALEKLTPDLGRVDLVITDNQMPRVDGMELVRSLRRQNFPGKIIVFSSSLTSPKTEELAELGVDAILEKGTSVDRVLGEIRRTMATADFRT